jgi:hypothetical protein
MRRASLFSRDNVPENPLPNEKVRRIVPASDLVARIALAGRHRNDRTSFLERSSGWLSILLDLRFDIARRRHGEKNVQSLSHLIKQIPPRHVWLRSYEGIWDPEGVMQ